MCDRGCFIFERDLVEHNTGGGGSGGPGGRHLHPAAPRRLALGVGGEAGQEAEVPLRGHPMAEDAGEAGHGEPEKRELSAHPRVVTMVLTRVVTCNNASLTYCPGARRTRGCC